MKQTAVEINPIAPRANAKIVLVGNRRFLVGGMTADKVTSDIYEVRSVQDEESIIRLEWKLTKNKNNIFTPRNSFAACGSEKGKIYIWGGLESKDTEQVCLHDLIEVDVCNSIINSEKSEMRALSLKEKICIHSSVLFFDNEHNQLIAIGGTNESSTLETFLYTLDLNGGEDQIFEWKKKRLDCKDHKGFLWQHTAHLSNDSYFSGQKGKFLTVIGGCHFPQSPYSSIVEFDLRELKVSNSIQLKYGLVSHDSIAEKEQIIVFGGATGGDFNSDIIKFSNGKATYEKGHNAVGCSSFEDEKGYYVVGGVSGAEQLNTVMIYKKN